MSDNGSAPTSTLTYKRFGRSWDVDANTLPAASVAAILQYGWSQLHVDATAFSKKEKEKALADAGAVDGTPEAAAVFERMAIAELDKRSAALRAGTHGVRVASGGAVSRATNPLERAINAITVEKLKERCAARNVGMPTGEVRTKALAAIFKLHEAEIRAEAQRRVEATAAISTAAHENDELDALLGGFAASSQPTEGEQPQG